MSGDVSPYLDRITSEFRNQPDFVGAITILTQGLADGVVVAGSISISFDLDTAGGAQLDVDGQWIGRSRYIETPLTGVYFAADTEGVGFDQGTIWSPTDPIDQLTTLPDSYYRTLLKATVVANTWNGTIPAAYNAWNALFAGTGTGILIQDNGNMSMTYALTGPSPDAVTLALFEGGYLNLKPAGVAIDFYMTPSIPNTPFFGADVENSSISGFDVGAIGICSPGM